MMKIAVVGAGIAGRLTAWQCMQQFPNAKLTVFDKTSGQEGVCSYVAAGMLAPISELETEVGSDSESLPEVFQLGERSLELWPQWLEVLQGESAQSVFYRNNGSLVVAHRQDRPYLQQFQQTVQHQLKDRYDHYCEMITAQQLEPELVPEGPALFLKSEGQVDSHQVMSALKNVLSNANWQYKEVQKVEAYSVDDESFDWVFDCRGLLLKQDPQANIEMQGVRGEVIHLHAPDVNLNRMVRVMHPRYRIYIVPRENQHYLIGATEIESEDAGQISVRSCLELLSAAYSVHKGFGEARIIETRTGLRPATFDRQPLQTTEQGLSRINGLYRHGYLLAPAMVESALKEFKNSI